MSTTSARILGVTRGLLAQSGPSPSMVEVARAAGVSRQAVYLHFPSRAQLFIAVVQQMDDEADIQAQCSRALQAPDPVDAVRAFLATWLGFVAVIHPVATMLLATRNTDADAWAAWENRMADLRSGYRFGTRRLAAAGRLRAGLDAARAADLAWALSSIPVWEQLTVDRKWSHSRATRETIDAVVSAITVPAD